MSSAPLALWLCVASGRAQTPEASLAAPPTEAPAAAAEAPAEPTSEPPAAGAPESGVPESERFPQGPLPAGVEKRPVPNLDNRPEPPAGFDDGALWVPRVLFFPLYVVSEYVVRRPLGALVTAAERGKWIALLTEFFTFDEAHKIGLVPTAYIEFDFEPSVGLYFFADDAFADGNDLRIHAAMWPDDWWMLTVLDRLGNESDTRRLSLRGNVTIRPDYLFHGLGPETRERDEVRYSAETYEAELLFDGLPWRASVVHWEIGLRRREFSPDSDFDRPSLRQAIGDPDHAISALPPGFAGYSIFRSALMAAIDTRKPFPGPAHGVRLSLRGEHAFDLEAPEDRRWVRYGGALSGFVDLLNQRVISLSLDLELVDPLAGEVPFTELATLGGALPLQGFKQGRLYDRSSAAAVFEYRWPVWMWLDFSFHYALGNVFGAQLEGLSAERMRSSFGFGLRTARTRTPDHSFDFLLAFGTQTIEQGHDIETVRFAIGGNIGF